MVNIVVLVGNVGNIRQGTIAGKSTPYTAITLATDSYMNRGTQDEKHFVTWHNVIFYGDLAVSFDRSGAKKGDVIVVEGKIQYNKKDDRVYTNIEAKRFSLVRRGDEVVETEEVPF